MIELYEFHFLRPAWFICLLPLAIGLWLVWRRRIGSRGWEAVCDPDLLAYLLIGTATVERRRSMLWIAVSGLLAIIALAGPTWNRLPQSVFSAHDALVVVLDLSQSMDAKDITPSRVERARFKIADILRLRPAGQTALLVYAADAFTVTPLTDDTATIRLQLAALGTDIMPAQGSRADLALQRAGQLLRQAGMRSGHVLLISDEVDGQTTQQAAARLWADGYRVSVLAVGTSQGAPVPLADGGFLKGNNGEIVIAALDDKPLRALAEAGGGNYQTLTSDDHDISSLLDRFSIETRVSAAQATALRAEVWREQGPWLILPLLPLAALAFRRGYFLVLLFALLPFPREASAFDWSSLWLTPDQQGQRALDAGNAGRAAQLFQDSSRKGAAQYRAGDYEAAARSLNKAAGTENLYNRANALARTGRFDEAVQAYDEVLKQDPNHEDARYNRDLVVKQLKQPSQEQASQPQGEESRQASEQGSSGVSQDRNSHGEHRGKEASTDGGHPSRSAPAGGSDQRAEQRSGTRESSNQGPNSSAGDDKAQSKPAAAGHRPEGQSDQKVEDIHPPAPPGSHRNGKMKDATQAAASARSDSPPDEQRQAMEQWLRRIPDDPGGLLRRKFLYQYQQRQADRSNIGDKPW